MKLPYCQLAKNLISTILLSLVQGTDNLLLCQTNPENPQFVIQDGHLDEIKSISFSQNGRFLASVSRDGTVKLWDTTSGLLVYTLPSTRGPIHSVAFSPNGKWLAAGGEEGTIWLWETTSYKLVHEFQYIGGSNRVNALAFNPASSLLAGNFWLFIGCWDLDSGQQIRRFYSRNVHHSDINTLAYSPDNRWLLSATDSEIQVWDSETGVPSKEIGFNHGASHIVFSPDGKQCAFSVKKKTQIWNPLTWRLIQELDAAGALAYSPNGQFLAVEKRNSIDIYDVKAMQLLQSIAPPSGWFGPIAFSPDSRWLASAKSDYSVEFWSINNGQRILSTANMIKSSVGALAISSDGKKLIINTGYGARDMKFLDLTTGRVEYVLHGAGYTPQIMFSPNNKWLAYNNGSWVKVFDGNTAQEIHTLIGHFDAVKDLSFSPDSKLLATISSYRNYSNKKGNRLQTISFNSDRPDTIYEFASIKIWNPELGTLIRSVDDSLDSASSIAFSHDGRWLATYGSSAIKLWNTNSWQLSRRIESSGGSSSIIFSLDDKYIVSEDWSKIKVWDVINGKLKDTLEGHSEIVNSIVFAPDGKSLASGSSDNTIKFWDLATGRLIRTLEGHYGPVESVTFTPDGKFLISAGKDSHIKFWETKSWEDLVTLRFFNQIDWICYTPDGYYDHSKDVTKQITWRVGDRVYPRMKYFDAFHQQGLLVKILNREWASDKIEPQRSFAPIPDIVVVSPDQGGQITRERVSVKIRVNKVGGGIGDVQLFHNGKIVELPTFIKSEVDDAIIKSVNLGLVEGINVLHAKAFNRDNSESNSHEIIIVRNILNRRPDVHLLMVGINKYKNTELNLNYARTDAQELARLLLLDHKHRFNTVTKLELFDDQATGESIRNALKKIKTKAKAHDLAVVFFAGHGEIIDDQFYYLPYETTDIGDNKHITQVGISSKELGQFLTDLRSQKNLVFLDACKSGQALLDLNYFEGQQSLEQQAKFSGIYILASSRESQLAGEIEQLRHGIFTYALLEGIKGQADILPRDRVITIEELFAYVKRRVPELAKEFNKGEQIAVSEVKRAVDFSLFQK